MTPEVQSVRKELYFAMGNCFTGAFGYAADGRIEEAKAAKNCLFVFVQFGVRAKLITAIEGNEILDCMRENGVGSHLVFEKHGHAEESADALIAVATGGK